MNNPIRYNDPSGHCPEDDDNCRARLHSTLPKIGNFNLPPEDDTWGHRKKGDRLPDILSMMANYRGKKWWSGSTPTRDEWTAFLFGEEGGPLLISREDKLILTEILLYKIYRYGPGEFTPATNPIIDPVHEALNFTPADWNAIANPNEKNLKEGFDFVSEVTSSPGYYLNKVPNFLYFVSDDEMAKANVSTSAFKYNWKPASVAGGGQLFFLQAQEDFCLVVCGK